MVHLCPRGDSIDGEVEQLLGPDDIHDLIDVLIDVVALFLEVAGFLDVFALGVAAGVDEAVHVHVEVVDVGIGTVEGLRFALHCVT